MIEPITDVTCVGDWIVGRAPDTGEDWYPRLYDFAGHPPEDWLTARLRDAHSAPARAEDVRHSLISTGTFRTWDWFKAGSALDSGLPDEVKGEIRRFDCHKDYDVYLLRVDDFRNEWQLLDSLAVLAGELAGGGSPRLAKEELRTARGTLGQLHDAPPRSPRSEARSRAFAKAQISLPGDRDEMEVCAPPRVAQERLWPEVQHLLQTVFRRNLGSPTVSFSPNLRTGLGFEIEVRSNLAVAYLALLANFSQGWKRCRRQDCGNVFRVTEDKRKVFCSQYCGHLASLRKQRGAARQRRLKRKASRKAGRSKSQGGR
jgi:hypothetical protein